MKVLLVKDVPKLGRIGQIKEVSDGHARNFLIPRHLALPATEAVLSKVQKEEKEKQAKLAKAHDKLLAIKNKLAGKTIELKGKAEGKNLFAGIHEMDIVKALTQKYGVELAREAINLTHALKALGEHQVEVKLSDQIKFNINLKIEAI